MKKDLPIVMMAVLALTAGFAWFSLRCSGEATAALAKLSQRRAFLDAGVRRAAAAVAALNRQCVRLQAELMEEQQHPRAVVTLPQGAGDRFIATLAANPRAFDLYLDMQRAGFRQQFAPLYRTLALSSSQIDQFESLLTEHEEIDISLRTADWMQGNDSPSPATTVLQDQEDARLRAAQVALLENGGYAQLQEFNRIRPLWPIVDEIASYVAMTPTPLTAPQAAQLLQTIADASRDYQNGGSTSQDPAQIDWTQVLSRASASLSDAQLAGVRVIASTQRLIQLKKQSTP